MVLLCDGGGREVGAAWRGEVRRGSSSRWKVVMCDGSVMDHKSDVI